MNMKLILMLFLTLFFINGAYAIDTPYYEPTCITPSYDTGYDQVWTSNNATTGKIAFIELNSAGSVLSGNFRLTNGSNLLCAISSRTTETAGITRVFGTSEDGSVWYFDNNLVDYSLGFYTLSPITFTCSGSGGNCNPIYKIGTLSPTYINRKLVEDSLGNIYVSDDRIIYVFQKSNGYAQSIFYTLVGGTDYTVAYNELAGGGATVDVIDLNIDASNTLHVLIGTSYVCYTSCVTHVYLSKTTINSLGVRTYSNISINTRLANYGGGTVNANEILTGGMIIDSINSTYNYSIIYLPDKVNGATTIDHIGTPILIHQTALGNTSISTITLNSVGDMGYYSNMLFVASWNEDIIKTYSTAYTGYAPISQFVGITELTYATKTIQSMQSTYYNRSDIYLEYNVVINSLDVANLGFLSDFGDYRWMISLTDPNGVSQDIVQSPACWYDGILDPTCQVTSTMGIHSPSNGWLAGSWTAKLYEVNIVSPNRALIATSIAFTVLNTSLENQSIAPPPFIPSTSGTSPQTVSIIDGVVGYFNIGVNATSKLLFSMVIIAIFLIIGLIYGKSDVAIVLAFVPYAFFTYIDYIPKWIFIITIILLAIASKVFR